MRKLIPLLLLAAGLLLPRAVGAQNPPPLCTVTGQVFHLTGGVAALLPVNFRTLNTQTPSGFVVHPSSLRVTTDANGNLPPNTNLVQGVSLLITVGNDRPIATTVPLTSSTTFSSLIGVITNPPPVTVGTANGGTGCASPTIFANLPSIKTVGTTCTITDATVCTVGTTVNVGGGSTVCQIVWDGTNWDTAGNATGSGGGGGAVTSVSGGTGISVSPVTGATVVSLINPVSATNGGTGAISPTTHGLVVAEGNSPMVSLVSPTTGMGLLSSGVTGDPSWSYVMPLGVGGFAGSGHAGAVELINPFGSVTFLRPAGGNNSTTTLVFPSANATTGQVLQATDALGDTTWATLTASAGGTNGQIQFNNSGVLGGVTLVPVANGGTGIANPTNGSFLIGGGSSPITTTACLTGQTINGSTGFAPACGYSLQLGDATHGGQLALETGGGGVVNIFGHSGSATSWNFDFPANAGANGQVLTTDGNGVTSWTAAGSVALNPYSGGVQITANTANGSDFITGTQLDGKVDLSGFGCNCSDGAHDDTGCLQTWLNKADTLGEPLTAAGAFCGTFKPLVINAPTNSQGLAAYTIDGGGDNVGFGRTNLNAHGQYPIIAIHPNDYLTNLGTIQGTTIVGSTGNSMQFNDTKPWSLDIKAILMNGSSYPGCTEPIGGLTNMTEEGFVKFTKASGTYCISESTHGVSTTTTKGAWKICGTIGGNLSVTVNENGTFYTAAGGTITQNTVFWYAAVVDSANSNLKLYLQAPGVAASPVATTATAAAAITQAPDEGMELGGEPQTWISQNLNNPFVGNIQSWRLSKTARYNGSVTAPNANLTSDSNTLALLDPLTSDFYDAFIQTEGPGAHDFAKILNPTYESNQRGPTLSNLLLTGGSEGLFMAMAPNTTLHGISAQNTEGRSFYNYNNGFNDSWDQLNAGPTCADAAYAMGWQIKNCDHCKATGGYAGFASSQHGIGKLQDPITTNQFARNFHSLTGSDVFTHTELISPETDNELGGGSNVDALYIEGTQGFVNVFGNGLIGNGTGVPIHIHDSSNNAPTTDASLTVNVSGTLLKNTNGPSADLIHYDTLTGNAVPVILTGVHDNAGQLGVPLTNAPAGYVSYFGRGNAALSPAITGNNTTSNLLTAGGAYDTNQSYPSEAVGTTVVFTQPATAIVGEVEYAVVYGSPNSGTATWTPPAGWTVVPKAGGGNCAGSTADNNSSFSLFTHPIAAADAGQTWTFTASQTGHYDGRMDVVVADATTPADSCSFNIQSVNGSNFTIQGPALTLGSANDTVVSAVMINTGALSTTMTINSGGPTGFVTLPGYVQSTQFINGLGLWARAGNTSLGAITFGVNPASGTSAIAFSIGFNPPASSTATALVYNQTHAQLTNLTLIGGGALASTGGSAPTLTAGCTAGGGSGVVGTNVAGTITTGATAATTCTMTFATANPFTNAPTCTFTDGNASITPVAYSTGAASTATVVVDFASASSQKIKYVCIGG